MSRLEPMTPISVPIQQLWSPTYQSGNRDTVGSGPRVGCTGVYNEVRIPRATNVSPTESAFARRIRERAAETAQT